MTRLSRKEKLSGPGSEGGRNAKGQRKKTFLVLTRGRHNALSRLDVFVQTPNNNGVVQKGALYPSRCHFTKLVPLCPGPPPRSFALRRIPRISSSPIRPRLGLHLPVHTLACTHAQFRRHRHCHHRLLLWSTTTTFPELSRGRQDRCLKPYRTRGQWRHGGTVKTDKYS